MDGGKFEWRVRPARSGLPCEPRQLSPELGVGGDNALSDRVTPRNFRKTRKPVVQPKPGALGL